MKRHYIVALLVLTLACERTTACTGIGCINTLTVEIQNAPAGPLTIRVEPVGTPDSARTVSCPGDTGCTNTITFTQFAPVHAHLTVTTTSGTRQWDVRPTFATSQPNGPGCGDICRFGTVRLIWQ